MNELEELYKTQRDMLLELCKEIATNKKTPNWIIGIIRDGVMKAKTTKVQGISQEDIMNSEDKTLTEGVVCTSNIPKDDCEYLIVRIADMIMGTQLFDVQIVKGNAKNPVGTIVHNVPETKLIYSRRNHVQA